MRRVHFTDPVLRESNSGLLLQFINCRVLLEGRLRDEHLWIRDGKIVDADKIFYVERASADIQIDCGGLVLSPGFIDIQINGGFGVDFSTFPGDAGVYMKGVELVSRRLLQYGVTAYAPTLITSAPETYKAVLPLLPPKKGGPHGATTLGVHIEGPFICKAKRGAHPGHLVRSTFLQNPAESLDEVYGDLSNVALVTLAPELTGALEAIRVFRSRSIVVSLGHSSANLRQGAAAVAAGAKCITHLFNAMQVYHHREPGVIGLLAEEDESDGRGFRSLNVAYGIIADGVHVHDSALRIAHRTAPEGLILVTDAIAALGMGDGIHDLGAQKVCVHGRRATVQGTETAAGSVADMPFCIRYLMNATRCSLDDALLCATAKPAEVIGVSPRTGQLRVDSDADFVLLSEDVDVKATFINGSLVFVSEER